MVKSVSPKIRVPNFALLRLLKQIPLYFRNSIIDEASDFKYGMQLGFAKTHHKIPPERKAVSYTHLTLPTKRIV